MSNIFNIINNHLRHGAARDAAVRLQATGCEVRKKPRGSLSRDRSGAVLIRLRGYDAA